jgi:hypothetical protein
VFRAFCEKFVGDITRPIPPGSVITASDYAVFVQGLPRDATEEEILEHFNQLYDLRKPDWVFPSSCNRQGGAGVLRKCPRCFRIIISPLRSPRCCFIGRKVYKRRQFFRKGAEPEKPKGKKLELWRELRDDEVYPVLGS